MSDMPFDLDDFDEFGADDPADEYGLGKGHCVGRYGCGAAWFGHRVEHCAACHQTFSSSTTGDAHRIGPHEPPGRRRCLTPDGLTRRGLWVERNEFGTDVWHGSPNRAGEQRRSPHHWKDNTHG